MKHTKTIELLEEEIIKCKDEIHLYTNNWNWSYEDRLPLISSLVKRIKEIRKEIKILNDSTAAGN